MREKEIEMKLKKAVEGAGGLCIKFISPGMAGIPDRLCLFPGLVIFIELKAPGKKPRPLQERQMRRLRDFGFRVEVIDSEKGIRELLESVKEVRPDEVHSS